MARSRLMPTASSKEAPTAKSKKKNTTVPGDNGVLIFEQKDLSATIQTIHEGIPEIQDVRRVHFLGLGVSSLKRIPFSKRIDEIELEIILPQQMF